MLAIRYYVSIDAAFMLMLAIDFADIYAAAFR